MSEEVASIQLHGLKKELILKKEDNKIHWKHSILLLTCQTALNNCLVYELWGKSMARASTFSNQSKFKSTNHKIGVSTI